MKKKLIKALSLLALVGTFLFISVCALADEGEGTPVITVAKNEAGEIKYYVDGIESETYTGYATSIDGKTEYKYYFKNGSVDKAYEGLYKCGDTKWRYYRYGVFQETTTGFATNNAGRFRVEAGVINWNYTCFAEGNRYYNCGKWDLSFTGFKQDGNFYYFVKKGVKSTSSGTVKGTLKGYYGEWVLYKGAATVSKTAWNKLCKYVKKNGEAVDDTMYLIQDSTYYNGATFLTGIYYDDKHKQITFAGVSEYLQTGTDLIALGKVGDVSNLSIESSYGDYEFTTTTSRRSLDESIYISWDYNSSYSSYINYRYGRICSNQAHVTLTNVESLLEEAGVSLFELGFFNWMN